MNNTNMRCVKIDEAVYANLEKVASRNGMKSVEDLLTAFAKNFSSGCSVTIKADVKVA